MTVVGTGSKWIESDALESSKLIKINLLKENISKELEFYIPMDMFGSVRKVFGTIFCRSPFINIYIFFSGGKPSLPSGLPSHFYYGFSGCIKRVKVFRKRLDLLRHQGDNSNLQFCETQIQSGGSVENWWSLGFLGVKWHLIHKLWFNFWQSLRSPLKKAHLQRL